MTGSDTPVTYSSNELRFLLSELEEGRALLCPRCQTELVVQAPVQSDDVLIHETYCPSCRHCAILRSSARGRS